MRFVVSIYDFKSLLHVSHTRRQERDAYINSFNIRDVIKISLPACISDSE